jgi:hypothetical protein
VVAGRIVSIQDRGDRLRVIVADKPHGRHEYMGVDVEETDHPPKLGDSPWWRGDFVFWTSRDADGRQDGREDVPIRRLSCSYSVD